MHATDTALMSSLSTVCSDGLDATSSYFHNIEIFPWYVIVGICPAAFCARLGMTSVSTQFRDAKPLSFEHSLLSPFNN